MNRTRCSAALAALALSACSGGAPARTAEPAPAAGPAGPPPTTPAAARGTPRAVQLALGDAHSCALFSDGSVRCWGSGDQGQLGRGNTAAIGDDEKVGSVGPVDVGARATAITAGGAHVCALLESGRIRCWGRGREGQLGYGRPDSIGDDETPASAGDVPLSEPVTAIAAGGSTTCALLASGAIRCWGDNKEYRLGYAGSKYGNLGDDEPVESWKPFRFKRKVTQLASNVACTCVLFSDGRVRCWGAVLGSEDDPAPAADGREVDIGAPVARLSLMPTSGDGCVITLGDGARCWGTSFDRYGEHSHVGVHTGNDLEDEKAPDDVGDLPIAGQVAGIAVGTEIACALVRGGAVKCWGDPRFGLLGSPRSTWVLMESAVLVDVGAPAAALAVGPYHSCVITEQGGVRCWGLGQDGRLGYGSTENVGEKRPPRAAGDVLPGHRPQG